jgi:uncharacterized protein involved in exopolysaccharide biosynthesis
LTPQKEHFTIVNDNNEIDLVKLFKKIGTRFTFIVMVSLSVAVLFGLYSLRLENTYKSAVTILPKMNDNSSGQFSGLAALAGINISSSQVSNEAFYEDVIKSNQIVNKLINKKWVIENNKTVTLHEFLDFKFDSTKTDSKRIAFADLKDYLRKKVIFFKSSKENGLMTLSVEIKKSPLLSTLIANWLANELHIFNRNYRQAKSNENVLNIKNQLDSAKLELTKAEDELNHFQKTNKQYMQSTELQLEFARLQREVLTENVVYTELRKQFEIAKIELIKKKKTITILNSAEVPTQKSSPNRTLLLIYGLILGFFSSILYVVFRA